MTRGQPMESHGWTKGLESVGIHGGELIGAMLVGFAKHEEFDTEVCEQFVLLVKMIWKKLWTWKSWEKKQVPPPQKPYYLVP